MSLGPLSICHLRLNPEDGDGLTYRTLRWGFDDAGQAWRALPAVAAEHGVRAQECAVIGHLGPEDGLPGEGEDLRGGWAGGPDDGALCPGLSPAPAPAPVCAR